MKRPYRCRAADPETARPVRFMNLRDWDKNPFYYTLFPPELQELVPADKREALMYALAQDPRPAYHTDPERIYGFYFAGMDVRFMVKQNVLTVVQIVNGDDSGGKTRS